MTGAIVGMALLFIMAGVPAIGAAKHNRRWDLEHPKRGERDA